jgi:UDP-N-acetylglucosamine--N-acetylmuramyl-(pentapeptide) pyrophosphoryl-undecaprenol N-acetylglucosamine transferase
MGREQGLERRLVGERGLPYDALPARPWVGRGPAGRLAAAATTGRSALTAAARLRRRAARVVLGTGGYACAPGVLGARLARRPVVLLEPNARAGTANRWLSRCARAAAVAWAETAGELACPARLTGVPVRAAFFAVPAAGERPGPAALLVLGGSQGAREVNRLVPLAARLLPDAALPVSIRHQCGEEHVAETRAAWAEAAREGLTAEVVPFVTDVTAAMAAADLVVSRAGAVTLAEICAAGRPALLLPLALAGGHQADNAGRLVAGRAAVALVAPTPETLAAELVSLIGDRPRLRAMGRAARALAHPGAAAAIADLVEEVAA